MIPPRTGRDIRAKLHERREIRSMRAALLLLLLLLLRDFVSTSFMDILFFRGYRGATALSDFSWLYRIEFLWRRLIDGRGMDKA